MQSRVMKLFNVDTVEEAKAKLDNYFSDAVKRH
jgi:hypothetical protein